MGLGGRLWRELASLGSLTYRSLLTLLFWMYKVSGEIMLTLYRWWVTRGRRSRLALLGDRVYGCYRRGMTDWPERKDVRELLTLIEAAERKRKDAEGLSRELDAQYRERFDRLWKKSPPPGAEPGQKLIPE